LARLTRHQLKEDELSARLNAWLDFFLQRKKQISIVVAAAIGIIAVVVGIYFYVRRTQNNVAAAFAKALNTYHAPVMVSPPNAPNLESYKTNDAKNQKALEEFNAVAHSYSRYAAGRMARYYAAVCLRELGKFPEAEKEFQALASSGDTRIAALAKVGLASVYESSGRTSEAEKVYKDLEQHPTVTVPKSAALVARADLYRRTNPAEASSLYQQIQKDYAGTPAGEHASQMLAQLPH